jgi:hypothetical protein
MWGASAPHAPAGLGLDYAAMQQARRRLDNLDERIKRIGDH